MSVSLADPVRSLANSLIATLLAPVCAVCRSPLEDTLVSCACAPCWASIPPASHPLCETCGDTLPSWRTDLDPRCARCRRRPRAITRGRSIAPYEGTLRELLHALKYDGRRSVARGLGARMASAGVEVLQGADALVPIPLHWIRRYRRGFNQAEELANQIGLPVLHALRRSRATVTQTDLPEAQRLRNVSGAFTVRRWIDVRGKVLVLVDDVSTTGATLDACARVLLDAGASDVRALTAARAAARTAGGRPPENLSGPAAPPG